MPKLNLTFLSTVFAGLVIASNMTIAQTASEIMKLSDDRYTGDSQISESVLTMVDDKGNQRVRNLKGFNLEKEDVDKSLIFFLSPSDVEGTAYLTYEWEDENREDDSWLYLPAMEKIRRVASSNESGSFMGSDFSYADINGLDYEDFNYELVKESEEVEGHDCWVIKSLPKDETIVKKTGYTSSQSWVRKDNYMVVKSIIEVKKGKRTKYFAAKDIEQIQGVWTAQTLQMVTTRHGKKEHASVIKFSNIVYNEAVDESMLDTQAMQRGL
jgi:hypothetical protein